MKSGQKASKNFIVDKKITDLNEFWCVINKDISIYARHRTYPTAFFHSWQIRLINEWIKNGYFWTIKPIINTKK